MDYVIYNGYKCGKGIRHKDVIEIYSEVPIEGFEFSYGKYRKNVLCKDCDRIFSELPMFLYNGMLGLSEKLDNGKVDIRVIGTSDLLEEGFQEVPGLRGEYHKIIDEAEGQNALKVSEYTAKDDGTIKATSDTIYLFNPDGTQSIWEQKIY